MLGRTHRFHGYGSVRRAYKEGRGVRGGDMSLRYVSRPTAKPYRVAVVVSRKVSKSAVKRNRIRRRLYEAVRHSSAVPQGTDIIFTVFNERVAEMPSEDLRHEVEKLLEKIA